MDLKLCFALLILCSSFLYRGHGKSFKDNKLKPNAVDLKTKLRQKIFHHHHHRYHYRHHHKHYPHHHRRHHDNQKKPHYHHHHHPYHDHHRDHHHHHHRYHHGHHHQHYPHHHRRHHDKQNKSHWHHHQHPYHDHHHHHHHHQHYHNPIKHYIHHSHLNLHKHHHHPRYHPHKHHLRVHHKKTLLHKPIQRNHQDQPRSHISQPPGNAAPNSLKVHVKINNDQAVKRQSLPELLSNLGQNLMTLGKNMTIKTPAASASSSAMAVNSGKKGDITHGIPMPQSSFDAEGLSSTAAVIPTHSRAKNVTATDLEALLHKALDRASGDDIRGGTASGGGEDMEDEDGEKEDTNTSFPPNASESPQHQHLSFHESADKRNETFVDYRKIRRLPESSEHVESERQSANDDRDDFTKEFMQRERSADKNDVEKKSEPFHGNLLEGADPKKSNLTDSDDAYMANETFAENIRDNDFQGESNKIKANQLLFDGPRSPDMNSKFEDTEVKNGGETANPVVESSKMTVTGENKSRERKKEPAEALGSGDQLDEETRFRGDTRKDKSSDVSVLDEDDGSGENSGQHVNENAQSPENDQERYHNKMTKQDDIIQESANAVSGDKIDGKTIVNNAGSYKEARLNEAPFEKDRKDSLQSGEAVDANASKSKLANKADIDTPGINGEHLNQGYTAEHLNEDSREDVPPSRTQSVSNDPESTISEKDVGKNYNVPDEQPYFQDFQRNQLGNPGQPVINATDENSGENTIVQETMGESSRAQEQGPLSDNTSFIDAPSSTHNTNSVGMDTEGTHLSDLYGLSSRENTTVDDDSDEIPVYMLSSPSNSKDSFNGEESTGSPIFTAPTSSVSTSSSFSYSEPSTLPLVDGSFSSIDDPSEGDQSTFPRERTGFQKDMLDDPVEESLDAAVDTRRSNVAVDHETVADS